MKVGTVIAIAVGLSIAVAALAFHFEVAARSRAYSELRGLRTETTADLDHHTISATQAAVLDSRLGHARLQIEEDDVRGAQKVLHAVKTDLSSPHTRSA